MKAIILAGGAGTRLQPVTNEIPKPLVPVHKKPILNHLLELLVRHGFNDVAVLASRVHEEDFRRWKKAWDGELPADPALFYEDEPQGTFGGLRDVMRDWIGRDTFLVSNGDELMDIDLTALLAFHEEQGAAATMASVEVEDARPFGVPLIEGDSDQGWVTDFLEKPEEPPSNFINSGLYIFEPEVFDHADATERHIMTEKDIFPKLAAGKRLAAMRMRGARWYECGTLERWQKAMREW